MFKNFTYTGTLSSVLDYPSVGSMPALTIPLVILDYKIVTRNPKVNITTGLPLFHTTSNNAVGGFVLGMGPTELPKFSISGYMDNPGRLIGGRALPGLTWSSGEFFTYGDYIAMMQEGRGLLNSDYNYAIVDPNFWRDPFGRQFNVRIQDFSATYVEGAPLRQNFQMTLQVTRGYDA